MNKVHWSMQHNSLYKSRIQISRFSRTQGRVNVQNISTGWSNAGHNSLKK